MKIAFPSFSASCEYINELLLQKKQVKHYKEMNQWIVEERV